MRSGNGEATIAGCIDTERPSQCPLNLGGLSRRRHRRLGLLQLADTVCHPPRLGDKHGSAAFLYCSSLKSVRVGGIASITWPSGLTSIGENAFSGCPIAEAHRFAHYAGIPYILTDAKSDYKHIADKKKAILLAYTGKAAMVSIPSKLGGYSVTLIWKSSNPKIAKGKDGTITALKNGTVIITATANDGSGKKAVCTIRIFRSGN